MDFTKCIVYETDTGTFLSKPTQLYECEPVKLYIW